MIRWRLLLVVANTCAACSESPASPTPARELAHVERESVEWMTVDMASGGFVDAFAPQYRMKDGRFEVHRWIDAGVGFERCSLQLTPEGEKAMGRALLSAYNGRPSDPGDAAWSFVFIDRDPVVTFATCAPFGGCEPHRDLAMTFARLMRMLNEQDRACHPDEADASPIEPVRVQLSGGHMSVGYSETFEPDGRYLYEFSSRDEQRRCEGQVPLETTADSTGLDALWSVLGWTSVRDALEHERTLGSGQSSATHTLTVAERSIRYQPSLDGYSWDGPSRADDTAVVALLRVSAALREEAGCNRD